MSPSKHAIRPGTLEAIVEASIRTLNANPSASMSEIAINAGVGRATLHRHFPTREHLIVALQQRSIREMNEAVGALVDEDQASLERLENAMRAVIPLGDRYSFLRHEYSGDQEVAEAYELQLQWAKALITELKADGHIANDIPDSWALALIDQIVWIAWDQVSRGHVSAGEAPQLAVRTLLGGLR